MRANQQGVRTGQYAKLGDAVIMEGSGTSGTNGGADMVAWQAAIKAVLPGNPVGGVAVNANGRVVTVTITWGERANASSTVAGDDKDHFVTFMTRTEI
jgi:hypothetical protein